MDLQKQLRFLTGAEEDEYAISPQKAPKHERTISFASAEDDDRILPEDLSIDRYLRLDPSFDKGKKEKKRSALFDDFDDEEEEDDQRRKLPGKLRDPKLYKKIAKHMSEDMIDDFESFLSDSDVFDSEDSSELANGLISLGRKYSRDTTTDAASSEMQKTFAASEEKLKLIYDDITRDIVNVGKDIDAMRAMTRGRNFKAISDMVSSKTSMHQARISAVKEMNAIKKAQFDMKMKSKAIESAGGGGSDISPNTFKSLFGAGRSSILGSVGGYASVSGATDIDDDNMTLSDEEIDERYFGDEVDEETEGDIYLKYESLNPHLQLLVDDLGNAVEVRGVDRDGNYLPDYPVPDISGLHFEINRQTGEATDDLHRNYELVRA